MQTGSVLYQNGNGNGNGNGSNGFHKNPISLISRIFNIAPTEWPRVTECWLITFFFKIGAALGWTTVTAAFVSHFGIVFLPTLFVLNALLIMVSTFFFEKLIMRIKREVLMILMLLFGAICLLFASMLYDRSPLIFFALIIFAESVFFAQFNVFIPILVGDRFTPMESQKTFPFIESAETIGGILGGILVGILAFRIPVPIFLYLWMGFLASVVLVFIITSYIRSVPPLPFRTIQQQESPLSTRDEIKKIFLGIKKLPFLKGLIVIVLLQWVFMNILEFQYTKAIEQRVTKTSEQTVANLEPTWFHAALLHSPEGVPSTPPEKQKRVLSPMEQEEFAAQLGTFKSIFHFAALIVQALLASRFITSLGIVGSLLLHPIIMLLSLVGMFLKFGFLSSVIGRGAFEVTNVIHKNAYFASHYALPRDIRDQAAEFLEGVIRPMGTIVGMLFVLGLQLVFSGKDLSMWIHSIMFTLMIIILIATIRLQRLYTAVTRTQLFSNLPYPDHLNAIEILAQKGHRQAPFILMQKLRETGKENGANQSSSVIRVKLLSALGQFRDYTTLPEILEALYDADPEVRLEAAHALMNFYDIGEKFYAQAFSRYRMVETLKEVFRKEQSTAVRSAIIRLFSLLRQPDTVAFLLDILKNDQIETKAACIYTLGLFKDPNAAYYIKPFLEDENPGIRASAISALWQFSYYRKLLEEQLNAMLESSDSSLQKAALFAIGESGLCHAYRHQLMRFLEGVDPLLQREAAFALTKCGEERGFSTLLETFLDLPSNDFDSLRRLFKRLKPKARKVAEYIIRHRISEELAFLMKQRGPVTIHEISQEALQRLQRLYRLSEQHEELFAIEEALRENQEKMPALAI